MRLLAFAAVATLLLAGVGAAGPVVVPPKTEELVEGHTVFTVMTRVREQSTTTEDFAAAVAVLVREREVNRDGSRFPGVLWFNDEYLIEPSSGRGSPQRYRHPCSGAVLATNAGDVAAIDYDLDDRPTLAAGTTYGDESYLVTDPNEHTWIVDRWNTTHGTHVWTVAIMNDQADAATPDDGRCNGGAYADNPCVYSNTTATGERCDRQMQCVQMVGCAGTDTLENPLRIRNPGANGHTYRTVVYNALLYFRLADLTVAGAPKNHTTGSTDWNADTSACSTSGTGYPCPGGNDDREGNSHPFNPEHPYPVLTYDGRGNHGGSADCDADGVREQSCHATREIDVYYGYVTPPLVRRFALVDVVGADAPYHCHDTMALCGPQDVV